MIPVAEIAPRQNTDLVIAVAEAVTPEPQIYNQNIFTNNSQEDNRAIAPILLIRKDVLQIIWFITTCHIVNIIINPLSFVYGFVLILNIYALLNPKPLINYIMILSNIISIIVILLYNLLICVNLQYFTKNLITEVTDGEQIVLIYFISVFLSSTIVSFIYIHFNYNLIRISILYYRLTQEQKTLLHNILN